MTNKSIIFFDLDGTLTDPAVGITRSVQHALRAFGIEVEELSLLHCFIGPPLADSFRLFYGFSEEKARRAVTVYREYFAQTGIYENEVYDGVPELLAELQEKGKKLILATSKPAVFARRILKHFGLDVYFSGVSGGYLDGRRTDKEAVVRYALRLAGDPETDLAVMVGDRNYDVSGAAKAGVACIGAAYGYGGPDELTAAGAAAIADTVGDLKRILLLGGKTADG